MPYVCLLDGSLIFSQVNNANIKIKDYFLTKYINLFKEFYKNRIPLFSIISAPKSKELVNIIKTGCKNNIIISDKIIDIEHVNDIHIMDLFLKPYYRSNIFFNQSSIMQYYPKELKIKFCYINISNEIIRVEFPAYVVEDLDNFNLFIDIVVDQCNKGQGYPIALSESHEQAVVKNEDREFFFQTLHAISITNNSLLKISQKSLKKRFVGVWIYYCYYGH